MQLDDRARSRGRPRENAIMNTRRDRLTARFHEFHFARRYARSRVRREREMYKKDRPCDLDGTSARACLRWQLVLDRGVGDRPNNTIFKRSSKDVLIFRTSFGHLLDVF